MTVPARRSAVLAQRRTGGRRAGAGGRRAGPDLGLREISHGFGDRVVLDRVAFDVVPGVMTGLLGPNGAGKTTLIRILLGVLRPQRGEVRMRGELVTEAARRSWGYMPQERGLYPAMKVGEQAVYFARLHGLSRTEAQRRARLLLEELDLADRWDERTDKLSGGLQQRLQLATSLVHDPEVVVLDEPFAGLDPVAVASLSQGLRQRAASGCTVLFSSHQLDLVQDLCEDIAMIERGRLVLQGNVSDLRASSGRRELRLHVGSPDRAWLRAFPQVRVVSDQADELRLGISPGTDPLDVLDAARRTSRVTDFGLDLPTLSELFLEAARATREPVA
jgi:ABC-2 type transport system ATP-binding protein